MTWWFGASWGAPFNEDVPHVETPFAACGDYREMVFLGDSGVVLPAITAAGEWRPVAFHLDCWLLRVVPCELRYPFEPGMTHREWARWSVWTHFGPKVAPAYSTPVDLPATPRA